MDFNREFISMTLGIALGAIASSMVTDTPFPVNAVDFDGTNDYLTRGAGLTGATNSSQGILSMWLRLDGSNGAALSIIRTAGSEMSVTKGSDNVFRVLVNDAAGAKSFQIPTATAYTAGATWLHLLYSWDTNFSAGNKIAHLYVNGVNDKGTVTDADTAFDCDYTWTDMRIGAAIVPSPVQKFDGCMSEFYFAPGQFLDFSDPSNRLKFRKSNGKPQDLGSDGSTPTGTAPKVYLKNAAASFGNNSGTGGNFTITGSLDTASTSPSD